MNMALDGTCRDSVVGQAVEGTVNMGGIHEGNDDHEHFPPGSADEGEGIADGHTTMVVGAVEGRHTVANRYKYNEALREGVGNKQASGM